MTGSEVAQIKHIEGHEKGIATANKKIAEARERGEMGAARGRGDPQAWQPLVPANSVGAAGAVVAAAVLPIMTSNVGRHFVVSVTDDKPRMRQDIVGRGAGLSRSSIGANHSV